MIFTRRANTSISPNVVCLSSFWNSPSYFFFKYLLFSEQVRRLPWRPAIQTATARTRQQLFCIYIFPTFFFLFFLLVPLLHLYFNCDFGRSAERHGWQSWCLHRRVWVWHMAVLIFHYVFCASKLSVSHRAPSLISAWGESCDGMQWVSHDWCDWPFVCIDKNISMEHKNASQWFVHLYKNIDSSKQEMCL